MRKKTIKFLSQFDSKNIRAVRQGIIVVGALGAIFIVLYIALLPFSYGFDQSKLSFYQNQWHSFLIEMLGTIVAGLFVLFFWEKVASGVENSEKAFIVQEIDNALNGIKRTKIEDAYRKASDFINECSEIRVIGSASLDHIDTKVKESISTYFENIESRISNEKKLKYRRLSPLKSNEDFIKHVQNCLSIRKDIDDFEVMLVDNFSAAYTYLIVDDKFLMLSLNFPDQSSGYKKEYCFSTENKKIIIDFIEHFKRVWRELENSYSTIRNISEYEQIVPFFSEIDIYRSTIREALAKFAPTNSSAKYQSKTEIEQTAIKLKALSTYSFEINHTIANGSLVQLLCLYMLGMEKDETYETITFYRFWREIVSRDKREPDFMGKTSLALSNGAIISRIFIVDDWVLSFDPESIEFKTDEQLERGLNKLDYFLGIKKALKLNIELVQIYPETYNFKILFTHKHDSLFNDFYNFALIKKRIINKQASEMILFEPDIFSKSDSTRITIYNDESTGLVNFKEIKSKIDEKAKKYRAIENELNKQKIEEEHITFLKGIQSVYFDEKEAVNLLTRITKNK